MKILFLNGYYPFCYYYRGYLPGVYSGSLVVKDFITNAKTDYETIRDLCSRADVIVFQRPSDSKLLALAKLLKTTSKKIIFENDDTYSAIPLERLDNEAQRDIARQQNKTLNDFLLIADGAIASTDTLKEEYGKINSNIVTLKNCIDPLDEFPCKENKTGKFRIGLVGSVTSNDDYLHIKKDILKLDKRDDITFVVMGVKRSDGSIMKTQQQDADFWSSLKNVEWHKNCHITEYMAKVSNLALDVTIIPRMEHYFNLCKSNLKFLEMSLLKIPVIAQGFENYPSPYQGVDEKYLTIAKKDWYSKIMEVKDNHSKYKTLAVEARDYVLENYNIKTYSAEWVKQIENLCKFQKNT